MKLELSNVFKRRITLLLIFVLYFGTKGNAQDCTCKTNLDSLTTGIENNYSGYFDKTEGAKKRLYEKFKDSLEIKSFRANHYECYLLLLRYISFFKDPHLNVTISDVGRFRNYNDTLRNIFKTFSKVELSEEDLKRYFDSEKTDSIEGIWQALSFDFKVAIYRDSTTKNKFIGVALKTDSIKWFPGQIKMEIEKDSGKYLFTYYRTDHVSSNPSYYLNENELSLEEFGAWMKVYPVQRTTGKRKNNVAASFEKISNDYCLLTIKNSIITYKKIVDSLVAANLSTIKNTRYLIIDIRNNLGGHGMTFDTLMPLIYTDPIIREGLIVRASRDNIELYKTGVNNPNFSESTKQSFRFIISEMEKGLGKMINVSDSDTTTYNRTFPYPEKVAIVVNKRTVSAAEAFVLRAKQSKKVVIFGENTRGALDYTELGGPRKLPCPYLTYLCPMGTTEHKVHPRIDYVGISPDVRLQGNDNYWITAVMTHFARKK